MTNRKGSKGVGSGGQPKGPSPLKKSGRRGRPAPGAGEILQQVPRPDPLKGKPGSDKPGKGGG